MTALTLQRTSAAKAGWIIGLLFFAWLAFLFVPVPRDKPKEIAPVAPLSGQSKLRSVGLADNPDWDGLPELFAVWSESAEWRNDKTQFAYWHSGSRTYAYYFEASRKNGKIRYRSLTANEALAGRDFTEEGYYSSAANPSGRVQTPAPNFESESPTHPFVFFREAGPASAPTTKLLQNPVILNPAIAPSQVTIEPTPKTNLKETSVPDDPNKK